MTREELIEAMARSNWRNRNTLIKWDDINEKSREEFRRSMRDLLTTIEAAGCRVVPVWPTFDMLNAGGINSDVWSDMLAASPFAPEPS